MDFNSFLWVMLAAWLISCFFYGWRIAQLLRGKGVSVFSTSRMSSGSRAMLRRLMVNILVSTIILLVVVIIAWIINRT